MKILRKKKFGYQFKKSLGIRKFNSIELDGDYAYCVSHNFIYNSEEEDIKLHNGQPCIYTDNRYIESRHNFYHNTMIRWKRFKDTSVKRYKNIVEGIGNIPESGVIFRSSYYVRTKPKSLIEYRYKQKSKKKVVPNYEVNIDGFDKLFVNDDKMNSFITLLRNNGFTVIVHQNTNMLLDMINTASSLTGAKQVDSSIDNEEYAVAYGHGMRVGFGANNSSVLGYSSTIGNICYDKRDEFCKWSRTYTTPKDDTNENLLKTILEHSKSEY